MNRVCKIWTEVWTICVFTGILVLTGCLPFTKNAVEPTQEPVQTKPQDQPTITPPQTPQHSVSPLPRPKHNVSPLPTPEPPNRETAVEIPAQAVDAVARARADMSEQLGISQEQIVVVSIEDVQWRDASLGCPQPGMMYAQVITPGYRMILKSGEKQFKYHSAKGQDNAVQCEPD